MLEPTDPIWDTFETVYDAATAGKLSDLIFDWWSSTGFDAESENYRKLINQIMHQGSITEAAYALMPSLVHLCKLDQTQFAVEYLTDVTWIETMRLLPDSRSPAMPDVLCDDYQHSMDSVPDLIESVLDSIGDADRTWGLNALKPAVYGNARLAFQQWTGRDE